MASTTKGIKPSENKESAKKYVVEEKDVAEDKAQPQESKSSEVKIKIDDIVPQTADKTDSEETVLPEAKQEVKPESEEVLKSDKEKDTLASSNVTSFSLLDSEKKEEVKENNMENSEKVTTEEVVNTPKPVVAETRSSNEEINKWIENYDEKEGDVKKKGQGFFKIFLIILTILSLLAVIIGGFYFYQKNISKKGSTSEETNETTVAETPTAAPTQAPETTEVDYSKYSLQILNGSGVPGEAGKAKDLLSDYDFKNVVTGNADSYDFEKTVISLKEGVPDQVFTDLKDTLNSTYDIKSTKDTLNDSSDYDVVVTVGVRK